MRFHTSFALGLPALASLAAGRTWSFRHDTASTFQSPELPAAINITDSQLAYPLDVIGGSSSYWSTSFVTGSNQHQYLVLSHVLLMSVGSSMARCSVLDITDPANYWMDSSNITLNTNVSAQSVLHLDYGFLGFQGISADSASTMRTWASLPTIGFNVTWKSSSKVLFNAGSAMFWFGSSGNTHEWSMPAGITSGTLTLNGTQEISIDSANSLTWYDRQWGYAGPFGGNWTWFELHFKDDTKASIWAIDQGDAIKRFATVRTDMGTHVLSYDLLADWSNTWTSDCSGKTYPLSWTLRFQNGEELHMESIRDDQELCNVGQEAAYEGFIIASGSVLGKKPAFGLVEMTAA